MGLVATQLGYEKRYSKTTTTALETNRKEEGGRKTPLYIPRVLVNIKIKAAEYRMRLFIVLYIYI